MFKLLLKTRIDMFLASLGQGMNKKKKKKTTSKGAKIALICVFSFLALYIVGVMFILFFGLTSVSHGTGMKHAPLTLAILIAVSLTLFGSIFPTKTQIFDSKDNELLLSMPIEPKYIFLSRLFFLLLVNYALEAVVMIPALVAYSINVGFSLIGAVTALVIFLAIPFFTLAVSSLIAWIVSLIASRLKNKTPITVFMFVVFFAAYMFFMGMLGSGTEEEIDLSGISDIPGFLWGARAMAYGDLVSFLIFILCCAAPALVAYLLLKKSFISIITTKKGRVKTKYVEKSEKADPVYKTLVKKELKRFTSSAAYMLNAGLGVVMTVLFAVMIGVGVAPVILEIADVGVDLGDGTLFDISFFVPVIAFAVVGFGSSMNLISAPSISLEDKSLWILQSLPVRASSVLLAKVGAHLLIAVPFSAVSAVILSVFLKLSVIDVLFMIIGLSVLNGAFAYFGLFLGLHFPKFDWENENVAVKQGFAVFGAMMGGMLWMLIMAAAAFIISIVSFILAMVVITVINGIICFFIHRYFTHGGEKRFASLKQ